MEKGVHPPTSILHSGEFGGFRSDAHKASVVGDTLGDPFKDTAGRAVVLEEQGIEQAKAGEVTAVVASAIPLTDAEKDIIRGELRNRIGRDVDLSFEADPDVLGGLILRAGDRVIDGSVVGQLERLQESLV